MVRLLVRWRQHQPCPLDETGCVPAIPLIVVDVQTGFVNQHSRPALAGVTRLLQEWTERRWPILLTQFVNPPGGQWERLLGWARLRSEPETLLHPSVAPYASSSVVVRKSTYTGVVGEVERGLNVGHWKTVVLCGIATEGCVLKTAVDLFEHDSGVRPVVVRDACGSHGGAALHETGLLLIERFIGRAQVPTHDHLLEELAGLERA